MRRHGTLAGGCERSGPQVLTTEHRLHLRGERRVVRLGQRRGGQLGIGLAATDLDEVDGDVWSVYVWACAPVVISWPA
jgi:hypothetical protein